MLKVNFLGLSVRMISQFLTENKNNFQLSKNRLDFKKKNELGYTQYGPIKNGRKKNQHSDFEKNKEPALRILDLKHIFTF